MQRKATKHSPTIQRAPCYQVALIIPPSLANCFDDVETNAHYFLVNMLWSFQYFVKYI